jgi:hypothetical protein
MRKPSAIFPLAPKGFIRLINPLREINRLPLDTKFRPSRVILPEAELYREIGRNITRGRRFILLPILSWLRNTDCQ